MTGLVPKLLIGSTAILVAAGSALAVVLPTDTSISAALQAAGYTSAIKPTAGLNPPYIDAGNGARHFSVLFDSCATKPATCTTVQLYEYADERSSFKPAKLADWRKKHPDVVVERDDDDETEGLTLDVPLGANGISDAAFAATLKKWEVTLDSFDKLMEKKTN